jgi:hypothetical protein
MRWNFEVALSSTKTTLRWSVSACEYDCRKCTKAFENMNVVCSSVVAILKIVVSVEESQNHQSWY